MVVESLSQAILPQIENELQRIVGILNTPRTSLFHEMLTYHMGWTGEGAGAEAQGKRLRPMILLLIASATGGKWEDALPAAASVELIHNFSLVHDDIQDQSDIRRGRPTVWKKWGIAHALNAGDALFILSHLALLDLKNKFPPKVVLQVNEIIHSACLSLTSGQYMDMSYESRKDLSIEDYWPMVAGKTAALLSACAQAGAVLGKAEAASQEEYRNFGYYLGMAFQVQDDYLGIWGDSALTGKSIESDLVTGKKSLPILFGLGKKGTFARRWNEGPIRAEEVPGLAEVLAAEGAKLYTQEMADQMMDLALQSLRTVNPHGEAGEELFALAQQLINRQT